MICPIILEDGSETVDYLMALDKTYIITDEPGSLDLIAAKSAELGLFEYIFKSFEEQLGNIRDDELENMQIALLAMLLILSLCIACMISALLVFIEEHMREFAIHLLSGATLFSIAGRIFVQIGVPIIMSNIIVYIVYGDAVISAWLAGISALLYAIIAFIPLLRISALGINGILKRGV